MGLQMYSPPGAGSGGAPSGGAGGVLGGTYPNPSFAVNMATQAELDAVSNALRTEYNHGNTGSSVTLNAANGNFQKATMNNATVTFAAPTNPVAGMKLTVSLLASGGSRTITLSSIKVPTGYTFTGVVASGSTRVLELYYTGTSWLLTSNLEFA